jgi:tetratricopeptide (TPR) repeat protein
MPPWFALWLPLPLLFGGPSRGPIEIGDALNPPARCVVADTGFRQAVLLTEQAYCGALARGYGALNRDPQLAVRFAQQALASHADAASRLLLARALLALGDVQPAWTEFETVLAGVPLGALSASGLHDVGVAAALTGHDALALDAYRRLLPRLHLLGAQRRARAPLEAALAALRVSPAFIPEARAAARRVLVDRTGRASHALALAVLRIADELTALAGPTEAPLGQPPDAWPDDAVLRVNRPIVPASEALLLDLILRAARPESEDAAAWQDLAGQSNPQWKALAAQHTRRVP